MNKEYSIPIVAAIIAAFFYILSEYFFIKFGDTGLLKAIISNVFGGSILILCSFKHFKTLKFERKDRIFLFVSSIFGFGLGYFFLYKSIDLIGASSSSFLIQIEPIFIMIFSNIFLKERLSKKQIGFASVLLFGVFMILFNGFSSLASFNIGNIYAILSALSFAIGIISINNVLQKGNLKLITGFQMFLGGSLLCLALPFFVSKFNIDFLLPYCLLGILMACSRLFYNLGLKKIGPSLTGTLYSTKIFIILVFSYLFYYFYPDILIHSDKNMMLVLCSGILILFGIIGLNNHSK